MSEAHRVPERDESLYEVATAHVYPSTRRSTFSSCAGQEVDVPETVPESPKSDVPELQRGFVSLFRTYTRGCGAEASCTD